MYWYSFDQPPLQGGSFATHPAHAVFHQVLVILCVVDLALQLYTFYLMLRVATKQLSEYRYFMILCTTWDTCIAVTMGVLFQPKLPGPMFPCLSARGAFSAFGNEGARAGMILVFTFATALVASQHYSLLYRLVSVFVSPEVKRGFLTKSLVFLFACAIVCATAGISYLAHLTTCRATDELFDATGLHADMSTDSKGLIMLNQKDEFNGFLASMQSKEYLAEDDLSIMCFNTNSWDTPRAFATIAGIMAASQLASLLIALFIIFKVRRHIGHSEKTRRLHVQLTRLLLLQIFCPVVCVLGPVAYMMGCVIIRTYNVSLVGFYLCFVGLSVFPMANALLTVVFVAPYRKFTFHWTRAIFKGNFSNSVELSSSTASQQAGAAPRRGAIASMPRRTMGQTPTMRH